ncbi:MAG: protein-export chaperone SecB [Alphaproteobacteria bacterium]
MTDIPDPKFPSGANGGDDEFANGDPLIHAHAQYIKDLSFENPLAIESATGEEFNPEVNLDCSVETQKLSDQTYEVVLSLEARAVRDDKTLFLVALDYAGLFSISNVPEEQIEPVLYVHCPTLLFPFARSVVANITKDGGYPPLLIDIINFAALYQHQTSAAENGENGGGGEADAEAEAADGEGTA